MNSKEQDRMRENRIEFKRAEFKRPYCIILLKYSSYTILY